MDARKYLQTLYDKILDDEKFVKLDLTKEWANKFPNKPGVYVLKEMNDTVYVGESGNLKKRINDLLDSRHHSVRRTLGLFQFNNSPGFIMATIRNKFPDEFEKLLNNYIESNFKISFLEIDLGRKELEEKIEASIKTNRKLNKRGKRKE